MLKPRDRMAGSDDAQGRSGGGDRAARRGDSRQCLRIHPADPDAIQRADLRRAQRRRREDFRRRPRHAPRRRRPGAERSCRRFPAPPTSRPSRSPGLPMLTVKLNRPALARLRRSAWRMCRRSSRSPSAERMPAMCSKGDRRFEVVVRLPEHLRIDIEAIKALPIPLSETQVQAPGVGRPRSVGQLAAGAGALRAALGGGADRHRAGPQPDQPRERQAANRGERERARSRPRLVRRRGAAEDRRAGQAAGGLLDRLGRPVRAVGVRRQAAGRSWCRSRCC